MCIALPVRTHDNSYYIIYMYVIETCGMLEHVCTYNVLYWVLTINQSYVRRSLPLGTISHHDVGEMHKRLNLSNTSGDKHSIVIDNILLMVLSSMTNSLNVCL